MTQFFVVQIKLGKLTLERNFGIQRDFVGIYRPGEKALVGRLVGKVDHNRFRAGRRLPAGLWLWSRPLASSRANRWGKPGRADFRGAGRSSGVVLHQRNFGESTG